MADLVERLLTSQRDIDSQLHPRMRQLCGQAAAEIEQLREAAQELVSLADTDWYDTVQTLADLVGMRPTWAVEQERLAALGDTDG